MSLKNSVVMVFMLFAFICGAKQPELVTTEKVRAHDIAGELFLPVKLKSSMAVIVLGGSSGRINRDYSERLAAAGIAALSLAYFGAEGLSNTLDSIPMETVSEAINYLESRLKVQSFGILGVSRGSELAFLAASNDARIKAVVGVVPSSVSWHGQSSPFAWSVAGDHVPSLTFDRRSDSPIYQRAERALESREAENAMFQFEKINGSILLVSASKDHIWPSTSMSEEIVKYLHKHNFPHQVMHIKLDDNHFVDSSNIDEIESTIIQLFTEKERL